MSRLNRREALALLGATAGAGVAAAWGRPEPLAALAQGPAGEGGAFRRAP